jgi:predicted esterase
MISQTFMAEKSIRLTFKARYFHLGVPDHTTRQVWFVLHGYGQLARYFIRKFDVLAGHNICVVAPEGLSRFYLEDVSKRATSGNNRVGATWMTSENRLADIENYLHYLSAVYSEVLKESSGVPVTVLGFSQGAATASRWVVHQPECCSRLVLWSGIFPPDMVIEKASPILSTKNLYLIYGLKDPFVTEDRLSEMKSLSDTLGVEPSVLTFDGGHEIDDSTLLKLI